MRSVLLFLLSLLYVAADPQMRTVYEWKQLDFDFPKNMVKKNWIQKNAFPLDADFSRKDPHKRMFVTTPKFLNGVPVSLCRVGSYSNRLHAYPSWGAHSDTDCRKMISVVRMKMTDCGHLWVIDSGVIDVLNSFNVVCPPKLLVFDLQTDKEIWRYEIPRKDLMMNVSLLGTVDVNGECGREYVYLADITGTAIVVVDRARRKSWRVQNQLTTFEQGATHFNIVGEEFDLNDGTTSLTSSCNLLYFHSLSGKKEHWVPINVINDENNFINNRNSLNGFKTSPGQRSGQSGPEALAFGGDVMLFSDLPDSSLYCWRTEDEFVPRNLHRVFRNIETFKFATGMKVIRDYYGAEHLLAVTCPFGNIMNGNIDVNEVNYRILKQSVKRLLYSTPCYK